MDVSSYFFQIKGAEILIIPESRAVVGKDNQLGFSLTDHFLGLLVAQDVFSTLHHQLETRVDGLHGLFLNQQIHKLKLVTVNGLHMYLSNTSSVCTQLIVIYYEDATAHKIC